MQKNISMNIGEILHCRVQNLDKYKVLIPNSDGSGKFGEV